MDNLQEVETRVKASIQQRDATIAALRGRLVALETQLLETQTLLAKQCAECCDPPPVHS